VRDLRRVIVHHSASPRSTTAAEIEKWHRAKGWEGIGYHYVLDGAGIIRSTRPLDRIGTHAKGANIDSIGICITGNNTDPAERWSDAQRESLAKLVGALIVAFGPLVIEGHRWAAGCTTATECPGISREEWDALEATLHA
jgi:N-acetylmuramoyl-L-alanine amidase